MKSTVTSLKVGVAKLIKQNTTSGLQRTNQNVKKEAKETPVSRRASAPERKISESEVEIGDLDWEKDFKNLILSSGN